MKGLILLFISIVAITSCSHPKETGRIYFFSKVTPGVNIFSINVDKQLIQHTTGKGSRDIDMAINKEGYLVFTSSRVLGEDREKRAKMGKVDRRQDINTYLLPPSVNESAGKYLANYFGKTDYSEAMAGISSNSQWLSFMRTISPAKDKRDIEKPFDEVYVQNTLEGEPLLVLSDSIIIKADWSPIKPEFLFAHYNQEKHEASLSIYNPETKQLTTLLTNPVPEAQIDAPKWSPDGTKVAFISHSLNKPVHRSLYIYDVPSQKLTLASIDNGLVQAPISWSSDGKEVVYAIYENFDRTWDDTTRRKVYTGGSYIYITDVHGKYQRITGEEQRKFKSPVFSPSNRTIAYMYADTFPDKKSSLRIIDRNGKLLDTLYDNVASAGYLLWQ